MEQQQQQALMNHFRISFLNIVTKMPVAIATEPATALAMPAMSLTLREELECANLRLRERARARARVKVSLGLRQMGKNLVPGWPGWP